MKLQQEQEQKKAQPVVAQVQQPQAQQCGHLDGQLQQAAQHHARCLGIDGLNAMPRKQGRAQCDGQDEGDIEQHRRR